MTDSNPDFAGWRTWPDEAISAAMEQLDDSTTLWISMADELAERDYERDR